MEEDILDLQKEGLAYQWVLKINGLGFLITIKRMKINAIESSHEVFVISQSLEFYYVTSNISYVTELNFNTSNIFYMVESGHVEFDTSNMIEFGHKIFNLINQVSKAWWFIDQDWILKSIKIAMY